MPHNSLHRVSLVGHASTLAAQMNRYLGTLMLGPHLSLAINAVMVELYSTEAIWPLKELLYRIQLFRAANQKLY